MEQEKREKREETECRCAEKESSVSLGSQAVHPSLCHKMRAKIAGIGQNIGRLYRQRKS